MTIILDANVLIAHANPADEHHQAAGRILTNWAPFGYAASVLTLAEFYAGPARVGQLVAAQQMIVSLGVSTIDLPATAAPELAKIRADHRLKMPDAVVLHTAQAHGDALATFDTRLGTVARRVGLRVQH
ncbi:type II toxin-antitoxin system VapC family toxin [Mycobacteroides abscessus]|uniref:type II toxin-antitoxin system VapC family toxin n=1 Tax=Mycobacteroides abscessus TaxID=36809 RepID=UPI0019282146|nr:PIN domain-containing protein [Mycobacteroides abscessus]MBL3752913.1 PIN domain-containing protein [Mycobacteroides abscessus subsp. massiliense]QSN49792.1 PIN domain-containing protein [Mycobacteroides abscessus subsp. abscessus]